MAKVHMIMLGCDKNRIDAELMLKKLKDAGHTLCELPDESALVLVNTCGFIEAAKKESIDTLFDMIRLKEDRESEVLAVIATGCLAERYREELARLVPELDAVVGIGQNGSIAEIADLALSGRRELSFDSPEKLPTEGGRLLSTPGHYAYLKIAEGCSNCCSYCAIPAIRGAFRSRKPKDILKEALWLSDEGVRELLIVAQDTTAYGRDLDEKADLSSLLRTLSEIDKLWKIRVLYAYPQNITDTLIKTIGEEKRIANYLDIPLQHADREILRKMGRVGDKQSLLALVKRLRDRIPGIVLRSSFIVGFPGETETQFMELLDFQEKAKIERAGCFAYSAEEGTPAFCMENHVADEVKRSRVDLFMRRQTEILFEKQRLREGEVLEVVVEGFDDKKGLFISRSEYDAPEIDTCLYLKSKNELKSGMVVRARVTGSDDYDLYGSEVEQGQS